MPLQDENQLTLIVLKVKGVIASFSCVMISYFFKHQKKKFQEKKNGNETRHVKKIAKLCQKGKKKKKKSQNSRKKKVDCT